MPTGYGAIFNDGVKYLKINKFDANGTDKSDYLAQMTSIRISHEDIGIKQYVISTTQVQNDYFIFGLAYPQAITSSVGNINDYSFTSSKVDTQGILGVGIISKVRTYSVTTGNTLSYFSPTTGVYTFGDTSNANIQLQVSINNSTNSSTKHYIYKNTTGNVYPGPGGVTADIDNLLFSASGDTIINLILTGSNTLTEGTTLAVYTGNNSGLSTNAEVTMSIIQITPPFNGSSSLIDFDPDAINFDYNDYNPLLDNAETPQYSTVWMDIDYSQNPLVPINFGLIISGTADRAFVQDSNYNSKAWSNIRYNGSRTTSYRINQ